MATCDITVTIDGKQYTLEPWFTRCDVYTQGKRGRRAFTRSIYCVDSLGVLVCLIGGRVYEVRRIYRGGYDVVRELPE